ncbi:MAG: Ezrin/radixin/moesin family protein [Flammeovirgaceae bacterium]|nr:Ezrin/radixin/moesin family protein [Flammeovirgaceae bacterium]
MKKFTTLFILVLGLTVSFDAMSQLSKKEKKEWKKRVKSLTPEQYKSLVDENKGLKGQVTSLNDELSANDAANKEKDNQIAQYEVQMKEMRTRMAASAKKTKEGVTNSGGEMTKKRPTVKGIAFKVQIGAFQNKDLSKYLDKSDSFFGEVGEDGLMRYTLGVFTDYWEADTFKKYMREMGVSDAWIISYRDGVRVPIKEVLENIPKS